MVLRLDMTPLQIAQLGSPEAVPVADQDHGGVPMATAALRPGCCHQPLDLAPGQNGGCVLSRSSTARMRSPKNDGVLKEQFVMAVTSFESRQVHRRSQSAPGAPRRSPTSVQIGAAPTGRGPNAQQHTHAVRQHTAQRQHSSDGSI
jgi:hypothetical protein